MTTMARTEEQVVALLVQVGARLRPVVSKLPMQPPARVLCALLDRVLLPRLEPGTRAALSGRPVEIEVTDVGLRLRLQLERGGFRPWAGEGTPVLRISATAANYWRLMRGQDDADRLFFERALLMEGDTELGLVLKNALDAIGPLWT
jgi:O2-independent ubiquinone biosynthesis accessory factor UbiT